MKIFATKKPPTVFSLLSDTVTPVALFQHLAKEHPTAFLFESAEGDAKLARYSFIGMAPLLTVQFKNDLATVKHHRIDKEYTELIENPLTYLEKLQTEHLPSATPYGELPFTGGWVGYLGYSTCHGNDGIPQQQNDPLGVPDVYLGLYDTVIVFDHLYRRISLVTHRSKIESEKLFTDLKNSLNKVAAESPYLTVADRLPSKGDLFKTVASSMSKETFCQNVEQIQQAITEGEAFQIVLAQRFSRPITCQPLDIYRQLVSINPSPYAYYLKFPEFSYLGSSPETFVKQTNGQVMLHALAGTRPRGKMLEEDQQLATELRNDDKEMAEHRMLVDLARNDLGRVCQPGSIQVGEIAKLLRYTHVMHLATEIRGKLSNNASGYDIIQSCLPRGTVSGAPKRRAMQWLAKLEPERRGIYAGMVGYIDAAGNTDGAIAIRSALIKDGIAHVQAGAGIVHHSKPEQEYEETRNKASSVLTAIELAERGVMQ